MDAFLARISYHATSYAIRSCLAVTSTLVIQQGSRLLQTVDDQPLRSELAALQRRLARKIELISPILESIEFRYTRGSSALEAVVRAARELRDDIDALAARYQDAAIGEEQSEAQGRLPPTKKRRAELLSILAETKQLMLSIDDLIPFINLWVSAIGGIQAESATFSPSRLLQASMLVNVGDSQFVLDPGSPMQIGPDFTLSLYMLFRGHALAQDGEAYGIEEGQRKPMWQEVIHKSRVRVYRMPAYGRPVDSEDLNIRKSPTGYAYQLQIVEDVDDGRVHTFEDSIQAPASFDGVEFAGIRETIPVGQISKMFYADVGRILNVNNDEGASSNPVLLLKRDTSQMMQWPTATNGGVVNELQEHRTRERTESVSRISDSAASENSPQHDIDRQLREESQAAEFSGHELAPSSREPCGKTNTISWDLPQNLDPEWLALEVFEISETASSIDEGEEAIASEDDEEIQALPQKRSGTREIRQTSVDSNLATQLQRMSMVSSSGLLSRPSSSLSQSRNQDELLTPSTEVGRHLTPHLPPPLSPTTIERSPFGAIRTSLSLLEMLLRLTSLQEFEQTTHLSIPDHVLTFYLDESASESGLHGKDRRAAGAEAARKMGFDPHIDAPGEKHHRLS